MITLRSCVSIAPEDASNNATLSAGDSKVVATVVVKGDAASTTAEMPMSRGALASASGATETETRRVDDDGTTGEMTEEDASRRMPTTAEGD